MADGFGQGYSHRLGKWIRINIFRPILTSDLIKYIQTDFAEDFKQVYSD